jgi:hypothetical protein
MTKNKVSDVRDHLVAMLEELGNPKADPAVIERAKASSLVAGTYIAAVKVELDAIRLHDDIGKTTVAIETPAPGLRAIGGGKS